MLTANTRERSMILMPARAPCCDPADDGAAVLELYLQHIAALTANADANGFAETWLRRNEERRPGADKRDRIVCDDRRNMRRKVVIFFACRKGDANNSTITITEMVLGGFVFSDKSS